MSCESFDDIEFDLRPFLQGQMGSFSLVHTQEHVSGGYTFASGTDAGRPLFSLPYLTLIFISILHIYPFTTA